MQTRIEIQATLRGRPASWTWDDAAAARQEANATSRPRGLNGPTPDEAWAARTRVEELERHHLQTQVASYRAAELAAATGKDPAVIQGADWERLWSQPEFAGEDRRAIRRALEASGNLLYPRRRIHLPIPGTKAARDS